MEKADNGLSWRMNEAMKHAGLSQREVANRMGKAPQQISSWLRGQKSPGAENIRLFAEAVGVTADQLLGVSREREEGMFREAIEGLSRGAPPRRAIADAAGVRLGDVPEEAVTSADRLLSVASSLLFEVWPGMSDQERAALVSRFADLLARRTGGPEG